MPKVSEAHRVARRDQIIRAAFRCVAREGFHKTTMADVIRESGLSAGAVYGYFASKQELIRAVAQVPLGGLTAVIDDVMAGGDIGPPAEIVRRLLDRVAALGVELDVDVPRLAIPAWGEAIRDPEVGEVLSGEITIVREAWCRYVVRAQEVGYIDPGADPEAVGVALLTLLPGFLVIRLLQGDVTEAMVVAGLAGLSSAGRERA